MSRQYRTAAVLQWGAYTATIYDYMMGTLTWIIKSLFSRRPHLASAQGALASYYNVGAPFDGFGRI